jgi:hypothetical protein
MRNLTPGTLSSIGRTVFKMHPELARSIITIIGNTKPSHHDLSQITDFMQVFCHLNDIIRIPRDSRTGTLYLKHVFLAAIIKLYNPEILTGIHSSKMRRKLRGKLAGHLDWNPSCVSKCVPVIITRLQVYEDFETDVTFVCDEFMKLQ